MDVQFSIIPISVRCGLAAVAFSLVWPLAASAETPPAGPEGTPAVQTPSQSRNFSKRVTMHNVNLGRIEDLSKVEKRPGSLDFQNNGNTSFFEPGAAAPYPPPVTPNQQRPRKDKEAKKKNWLTPKSNVDGLDLQPSENNALLDTGNSWGWLVDEVMKSQWEDGETDGDAMEGDAESLWNEDSGDLGSDGQMNARDMTEEDVQAAVQRRLREGQDGETENRTSMMDHTAVKEISMMGQDEEKQADVQDGARISVSSIEESPNAPWRASYQSIETQDSLGSRLDSLNQSVRKEYSVSGLSDYARPTTAFGNNDPAHTPSFQRPSFSAQQNRIERSTFGTSSSRPGAGTDRLQGSALGGSASRSSIPSASASFRGIASGSPQTPLQAFQPLDDRRP